MKLRLNSIVVIIVALVLAPRAARSQPPLADRVPADALVYLGWAGSQNLAGAGYEGSHLQALAASSDAQKLFTDTLPKLAERISAGNEQAGEVLSAAGAIGTPLWKHPTAI